MSEGSQCKEWNMQLKQARDELFTYKQPTTINIRHRAQIKGDSYKTYAMVEQSFALHQDAFDCHNYINKCILCIVQERFTTMYAWHIV